MRSSRQRSAGRFQGQMHSLGDQGDLPRHRCCICGWKEGCGFCLWRFWRQLIGSSAPLLCHLLPHRRIFRCLDRLPPPGGELPGGQEWRPVCARQGSAASYGSGWCCCCGCHGFHGCCGYCNHSRSAAEGCDVRQRCSHPSRYLHLSLARSSPPLCLHRLYRPHRLLCCLLLLCSWHSRQQLQRHSSCALHACYSDGS